MRDAFSGIDVESYEEGFLDGFDEALTGVRATLDAAKGQPSIDMLHLEMMYRAMVKAHRKGLKKLVGR